MHRGLLAGSLALLLTLGIATPGRAARWSAPEWLGRLEPLEGEFTVRADRPRLYLTAEDLPVVRARVRGSHRKVWEKIQAARRSDNPTHRMLAEAFTYVIAGDSLAAREAIEAALKLSYNIDDDLISAYHVWPEAVVYDWCHDRFSREEAALLLTNVRAQLEAAGGKGLEQDTPHTGHLVNYLADAHLPAGIAFYEDDPEIYKRALGVIRLQVAAKNIFYRFGASSQGDSYGVTHFNGDVRLLAMLWKATGVDLFERFPFYREPGYYWIYTRRPDGQLLRNGDDWLDDMHQNARLKEGEPPAPAGTPYYDTRRMWTHPWLTEMLLYPAVKYRDPWLLNEYLLVRDLGNAWTAIEDMIWRDAELKASGPQSLPPVRYLDGAAGTLLFRSGWGRDDVVGMFKVMPLFIKNHDHLDRLSFQIYGRGALALDSGIYEGTQSQYDSDHWLEYFQRSIAHNTLLVRDPREEVIYRGRRIVADGGQRYPKDGANLVKLTSPEEPDWYPARVLAREVGPEDRYAFVTGDATAGYGPKAELVKRTFVFLKGVSGEIPEASPAASILIHDRVRSKEPGFEKVWLLHTLEEPEVQGTKAVVRRGGENYGGSLVSFTLLPASPRIVKIGGPGKEFWVNDRNYPTEKGGDAEGGAWRLEVSAQAPAAETEFLHALLVYPGAPPAAAAAYLVSGKSICGADLGEWTVIFLADGAGPGTYEYSCQGTGVRYHLLIGLPPGRRVVVRVAANVMADKPASPDGVVVFRLIQTGTTRLQVTVE